MARVNSKSRLTARQKDSPNPIPMCGVPHHAAANYIARLVKKGYRVAICEQTETPGKGVKLVKREVVRVITPGTAIDPQLVESKESVYLAAVCGYGETFGAAFLETSSGQFSATQITAAMHGERSATRSNRTAPRELLYPQSLERLISQSFCNRRLPIRHRFSMRQPLPMSGQQRLTPLEDTHFRSSRTERTYSPNRWKRTDLAGFGFDGKTAAIRAAGACLRYAQETQRAARVIFRRSNILKPPIFLILDAVTLRNLEIFESRGEKNRNTLFGADRRNA